MQVPVSRTHCCPHHVGWSLLSAFSSSSKNSYSTDKLRGAPAVAATTPSTPPPKHAAPRMRSHKQKLTPLELAAAIGNQDKLALSQGAQDGDGRPPTETKASPFTPTITLRQQRQEPQQPQGEKERSRQKARMGALQSVPSVSPSNEHLASALKRASRVGGESWAPSPGLVWVPD